MQYCENSPSGLVDNSGNVIGWQKSRGNWHVKVDGVDTEAHRVIWEMFHGPIPDGMVVDHENRDASDNLISNLRIVTQAVNTRNRRMSKRNVSGHTGVFHNEKRNRWEASWREDEKTRTKTFSCSTYHDAKERAIAYRIMQIDRLNTLGYGYTATHGV